MTVRLALLGGQAICLGLTACFLIVAATSVFLSTYGAGLLPYAYIAVAVAGVVVSSAMTAAQRRLTLAGLAATAVSVVAVTLLAGWAALSLAGLVWVTFPLVVLTFLWIPVGFVLIGAQSGRLLDIQQLKAYFPRVAAGFAAGFIIGGLVSARLVPLLGSPADLLLVDAAAAGVMLGLVVMTALRHPAELRTPPVAAAPVQGLPAARPTLRSLLSNRLVVVLLGYQLLSAAVTQLLDFLVWQQAAARYPDPADLARFLALFGAVINVVGLLFVFLVAGALLSRYGLRFGLPANPAGVLVLVVACTLVGLVAGQGATIFFLLVCAQQVVDIALTDGTTRGSINAVYQALPPLERLAAQTRVEAVGVPAAIGCVGILLIVFDRLDAGTTALLVVVLVATLAWLGLAFAAYALYGSSLRRTITRRSWDPVALTLDDDASRQVVHDLLGSQDPRDVAVAVDALAAADADAVLPHLEPLLASEDPDRRRVAVAAAQRHRATGALPFVLATASNASLPPDLRAEAARAACVLGARAADLGRMLSDPADDVRATAAVAMLAVEGREDAVSRVRALLLGDDAAATRATLTALCELPHALAVPGLLELAARPAPPRMITEALQAHGPHLLSATTTALSEGAAPALTSRLLTAVAEVADPEAERVLVQALGGTDRAIGRAAVRALGARDSVDPALVPEVRAALVRLSARASRALDALADLHHEGYADDLCRALRDDLRDTAGDCSVLLGLLNGPSVVATAVRQLGGPARSMALETLSVSLGRSDERLALGLLDPTLTEVSRRAALDGIVVHQDPEAWMVELALDPDDLWQEPWLRAAALWALVRSGSSTATAVAASVVELDDPVVVETARAALSP